MTYCFTVTCQMGSLSSDHKCISEGIIATEKLLRDLDLTEVLLDIKPQPSIKIYRHIGEYLNNVIRDIRLGRELDSSKAPDIYAIAKYERKNPSVQ